MKDDTFRILLTGLLTFGSIAIGLFLTYYLLLNTMHYFSETNATIITAIFASTVALLIAIWNQRSVATHANKEALRAKKSDSYCTFIEFVIDVFVSVKEETLWLKPEDIETALSDFKRELVIWGCPDVLKKCNSFSNQLEIFDQMVANFKNVKSCEFASQKESINSQAKIVSHSIDELFRSIRKDLGNSNSGLSRGDLHGFFLDKAAKDSIFPK